MDDEFFASFKEAAIDADVPEMIWDEFFRELFVCLDDPRLAGKVSQKWLSTFQFEWPDGRELLQEYKNQKGTFKQLSSVFSRYVIRRYLNKKQLVRATRTIRSHPYFLLSKGTNIKPCPVHGNDYSIILPIDDPYWSEKPISFNVFCDCSIRQISVREYDRIKSRS